MQINNVQRRTSRAYGKRVGRGGKRGKTAGRGTKGQKARSGHRIRPEIRDTIKKIPKKRGYQFASFVQKPSVVNLSTLEKMFQNGDTITPTTLVTVGLVHKERGAIPAVKILGTGSLTKALTVSGCALSTTARAAIEKAGGSVTITERVR